MKNNQIQTKMSDDFKSDLENPDMLPELEWMISNSRRFYYLNEQKDFKEYYNWRNFSGRSAYLRTYPFSNENLKALFEKIDVKNKNVLTVGSSGDQALNAIFYGAKKVTLADFNIYTQIFVELKMALIQTLTYKQFVHAINNRGGFFGAAFYKKCSHLLSPRVQIFWDTIMLEGLKNEIEKFFVYDMENYSVFYQRQSEYETLQKILKERKFELEFVCDNVVNFPEIFTEKYDLILLSNVYDYFWGTRGEGKQFMDSVLKLYKKNLNRGGMIQVSSSFSNGFQRTIKEDSNGKIRGRDLVIIKEAGLYGEPSAMLKKRKLFERERLNQMGE